MEYFLKDSYHTLLCSLGFVGIGVFSLKMLRKLVPSLPLAQCESLLVLGSHYDVPSSNHFLQFCTVELISF